MNRRNMLHSGAGLSLATLAGLGMSTSSRAQEKAHQHYGAGAYGALAASAGHCVTSGQTCLQHCLEQLATGNKDMAKCAKSVLELMSACTALQQLANWDSSYVPRMAKVVQDICKACEQECRKHESKHAVCKECADACVACAKECQKVAA
jgi:Cys-rich four helix bundle protein (predicted Tat secretion target)